MATGYGLDDGEVGVRVPVGTKIVPSPQCPDRHWGPPSLLSNEYRDLFSRRKKLSGYCGDFRNVEISSDTVIACNSESCV
jgi:hypothetical protein